MSEVSNTPSVPECDAQAAGYDGMFGVYCALPAGHEGPHCEAGGGAIEWDFVDPRWRNSAEPPRAVPDAK